MMTRGNANPFTPMFGQIPLHMAGRQSIIADMQRAFSSKSMDPNLVSMIIGTRGTGKTALLSIFSSEAEKRGWIAVNVSSLPGVLENIYEHAVKATSHLAYCEDARSTPRLSGISIGGFGLEWSSDQPSAQPIGTWRTRMEYLLDALLETQTGLLICVDEVDPELPEMAELAASFQHFLRDGYRASLVMAGLPTHVLSMLSGKSTSFLRRARQHRLERVPDFEIERAFESTLIDGGKRIDDDALEEAIRIIDGFPFMMQILGYRCWITAGNNATVNKEMVEQSAVKAERELRECVYDTVFHELSPGDRDFLAAMLDDEKESTLANLRQRLGKSPQQLSYQKKRLVRQGIVRDKTRGIVTFDMPGIREYLADQLG